MNEVIKREPKPLDGFRDYDDTIEGDDDEHGGGGGGGGLVGTRLKFTNEARWEDPEGTDYTGRELIVVGVKRTEVKWGDGRPLEVRVLEPGEKYRDLDKVNETVPKAEWREDMNGKLQGPWQRQTVLNFLLAADTVEKFSWP